MRAVLHIVARAKGVYLTFWGISLEIDMLDMHLDEVEVDIRPPEGRWETLVEKEGVVPSSSFLV